MAAFEPSVASPLLLESYLDEPDGVVRFRIIRGLSKLRDDDPGVPLDARLLTNAAEENLRTAFRHTDWRVSLARAAAEDGSRRTPAFGLIDALLQGKTAYAVARLFRLLGRLP